jgi:hypothetical protein
MMVSTTPAWGMEPTTSSLGAMSHYHQAKARGALTLIYLFSGAIHLPQSSHNKCDDRLHR